MTQIMPKLHLAFGGAGPFARLGEYAYPAVAYFSMKKSRQKSFRAPP